MIKIEKYEIENNEILIKGLKNELFHKTEFINALVRLKHKNY